MSKLLLTLGVCITLLLCACTSTNFQQLGSSILSSTGLVSSSQADAIFQAGGKLAKASSPISEEEEYYLGRGVAAVVLAKYKPLERPALQNYVNQVGKTVVAFSNRTDTFGGYHFLVLDSEQVNALSAPGGFVFLTHGFLKLLPNEEALAAVLAHEVGHVALNHGIKAISESNLSEALTIIGKEAALAKAGGTAAQLTQIFGDSVKDVADKLLTNGYSRSQEYAADEYATLVLGRAGYNQSALYAVFDVLDAKERSLSTKDGWFSTHPSSGDRRDELEGVIRRSSTPATGESIRTARFRANVKRIG